MLTSPIEGSIEVRAPDQVAEWVRNLVAILDAQIWTAVLTVAGVILGAFLTHKFTLRSQAHQDNRDRLIGAALDSLQTADEILQHFRDVAYHGPRSGGRIRDVSVHGAKWTKIPRKDARKHDLASASAIQRIGEATDKLRRFNNVLSVYGPPSLTQSFRAIPDRVASYFQTIEDDRMVRGTNTECALEDMMRLFDEATAAVREIATLNTRGRR